MDCLLHASLRCTWHELECLPLISAWRVIHCSREFRFPFFSKALCFPGCLSSSAFLPLWNLRLHFIMVLIILYCHPVCLPSYTRRFFVFCFFHYLHCSLYTVSWPQRTLKEVRWSPGLFLSIRIVLCFII